MPLDLIFSLMFWVIFGLMSLSFYHYLSHGLHNLQLSGYVNPTFELYEKNNNRYIYAPYKCFLLIPCLCAFAPYTIGIGLFVGCILICLWFAWVSKPLPAKKPFVVTARVKRLYTTAALLYVSSACLIFTIHPKPAALALCLLGGLNIFVYPFIRLCNLINMPIEKNVANGYIKDAKRILKAFDGNLTIIGITGSFGKTSVKYFLNSILQNHCSVIMTPASYNTPMGIVKTIREMLKPIHSHFIVEMGARKVGEIKELCDIVEPQYGIVTYIGNQHLETFETTENIAKTKLELADSVMGKGTVFVNLDCPEIKNRLDLIKSRQTVITYGVESKADYRAYDLSVSEVGVSFTVETPDGGSGRLTTKLLGKHNVVNILGAIALAHHIGMELSAMVTPVALLAPVPHRLELKPAGENVIIDDAFNSNPIGAQAALEALSLCNGMKIIVTPGMVELGDAEYELNRNFGRQIAKVCDYVCLVTKHEHIYDGLMDEGYPKEKIFKTLDVKQAISHALALENKTDGKRFVLLENDLPDNYL